jgi:magnesium transporter
MKKNKTEANQHYKKHKRQSKTGLPPGTHVYTGHNTEQEPEIEVYVYDATSCTNVIADLSDLEHLKELNPVKNMWINVFGLQDLEIVKTIADQYNIDKLYQEDIVNVFQRTKMEEEDNYILVIFKALMIHEDLQVIEEEQITTVLTEKAVLTFQERPGDQYDILRSKLQNEQSIIKEKPSDYLFYRILDITVDVYFDITEKIGDNLEAIEAEVSSKHPKDILLKIQNNKKNIMVIRKNIYAMRDVMNKLANSDHKLIDEKNKKYLRDVHDHTIQILETIETYRDINVGLKDVYLNTLSNEMNRVMKILTIISTFFIPLTFIVGVYGMNFKYMPELGWKYGYLMVWILMVIIVIGLSAWFKRKGWF